jgi:hypothetical protein
MWKATRVFIVSVVAAASISAAPPSHAQTLWCKHFDLGCPSEDEKKKIRAQCMRMAKVLYDDFLKYAYEIDRGSGLPNWQAGGYRSAQQLADQAARSSFKRCLKGHGLT